ncbi:MAG: hypothetical protein EXS48_03655 [Candidatus Staskawiczbacteria bacterium]|nr:hypothetical protein [Candidatus Staskawiczbacteria bacterium]
MKKIIVSVALVAILGGIGFYLWNRDRADKALVQEREKTAQELVAEEIHRWYSEEGKGERVASKELAAMIETDPDYVAVVIGWHMVKGWGSITSHVSADILDHAKSDSAGALKELKKFLVEDFTAYLIKKGYKDPKSERVKWCNNNNGTAFLLITLPVAERAGKKKEFLCEICGAPSDEKGYFWKWISMYVPDNGYHDWYGNGIWPWKDEVPPEYWHCK